MTVRLLSALLLAATLTCPSGSAAQQEQKRLAMSGIVTDSLSHRPIERATVTVLGEKANPEVTDHDGTFLLNFSVGVQEGDIVRLHVEKAGYKIYEVNRPVSSKLPLQIPLEKLTQIPLQRSSPEKHETAETHGTTETLDVQAAHHGTNDNASTTVTHPTQTGPIAIAPNGVANAAPNFGSQVVNNFNGIYPPPGVVPHLTVCISNKKTGDHYETDLIIKTDTPISEPTWWFAFDGPVDKISADADSKPFGFSSLKPSAGTAEFPVEDIMGLTITQIGGSTQRPWQPDAPLEIKVSSSQAVRLKDIGSRSLDHAIDERFSYTCDSDNAATPQGHVNQNNTGGINVQQVTTGNDSPIVNSPITITAESSEKTWTLKQESCESMLSSIKATGQPLKLSIGWFISDADGANVESELAPCLSRVRGWEVSGAVLPSVPAGLTLVTSEENLEIAKSLQQALQTIHLDPQLKTIPNTPDLELWIGRQAIK